MTETILPATVALNEELRVVPIYAGEMKPSLPIDTRDVVKAAQNFELNHRCLGFAFAKAVSVRVKMEGREDISFSEETVEAQHYIFATKLIMRDEFMNAAEYKEDYRRAVHNGPYGFLSDPGNVLFEYDMRVWSLSPEQQKSIVLIDKKGTQLWPQPKP